MKLYTGLFLFNMLPILAVFAMSIPNALNLNSSPTSPTSYTTSYLVHSFIYLILAVSFFIYVTRRGLKSDSQTREKFNTGQIIGFGITMIGSAVFLVVILFMLLEFINNSFKQRSPMGFTYFIPNIIDWNYFI